jgi:RNA polymerase sigma factor for flagellar operon FliA
MTPAEFAYQTSSVTTGDSDDLVMQEISQVYYIATRIRERLPQQVELEDLVSSGVVGLLEAARSFDPSKNVQFRTFAKFRIHGAIMDSLRETDWGSRYMRKMGREISEAKNRLQVKLGRPPSEPEIAQEMGIDISRLQKLLTQLDSLQIVGQQVMYSDGDSEPLDVIESAPNTTDPDPLELFLRGEKKALLAEAISQLSEREQTILSLYYREELTMKEISEVVGVSLSRVSQIRDAVMSKLRITLEKLETKSIATASGGQPQYV